MIRLILALTALLALHEALALDMVQVNRCMNNSAGWQCPDSNDPDGRRYPKQEMRRVMTRDQARIYCECRIMSNWVYEQEQMCLALSRACEYGDI